MVSTFVVACQLAWDKLEVISSAHGFSSGLDVGIVEGEKTVACLSMIIRAHIFFRSNIREISSPIYLLR
jgi:hypothetical protein